MSGPPKSRSTRTAGTNVGSPKGRESYGDAVPVVVAGVTTCQGGRESRPQGEGEQVIGHHEDREVCVMQNAETVLGVLRERGRRGLPLDELYRQLFLSRSHRYAERRLVCPPDVVRAVEAVGIKCGDRRVNGLPCPPVLLVQGDLLGRGGDLRWRCPSRCRLMRTGSAGTWLSWGFVRLP